jgi:K+-sensing histidine kinase KdpD
MKIFIYKTAIIAFTFALVFEILIGSKINHFKKQINEISTKQKREKIILKIKDEIRKANVKDNYLNKEDRLLLSTFIKKIINELNLKN